MIDDTTAYWKRHLELDVEKKHVIYCGHLYPDKAIDVLISVAESLNDRDDVVFLFVGGLEKWRRHWQQQCKQRQIRNVGFTGFVPNSQVPHYLKAADCLALPYRLDREHKVMDIHTTSPLKLFEYMAAKRAIVATGIPAVTKVLQHARNALLAPAGDLGAFRRLVEQVLAEPELNQVLGERAFEDVQKYTWAARCNTILATLAG